MNCKWQLRTEQEQLPAVREEIQKISKNLAVSSLLVNILYNRGYVKEEDMSFYLKARLQDFERPAVIPNVADAAKKIVASLEKGDKIAVWGDYDVDGISSCAVVKTVFASRNVNIRTYIPKRSSEGYGLNKKGIEKLADEGIKTLITVDCGIADVAEIAYAKTLGLLVIISDHHLPQGDLPVADAICNPQLEENNICSVMAGVGVAFMLMAEINTLLPENEQFGKKTSMKDVLDYVCLGTVADIVPLRGMNRIIVKHGLSLLETTNKAGLLALKTIAGYNEKEKITAGQVGFQITPRINAAGRMGDSDKALELLVTDDIQRAKELATELDAYNQDRRAQESDILAEALEQAEQYGDDAALVLYSPNWHAGIIGIVASRLVDRYYRPTILLCAQENEEFGVFCKGSGRSIAEVHLFEGLQKVQEHLIVYGGHAQAAGMSLLEENIVAFREMFNQEVLRQTGQKQCTPTLKIDMELSFKDINMAFVQDLEQMHPFGMRNAEPVFSARNLKMSKQRIFGKENEHISFILEDNSGKTFSCTGWRMAELIPKGADAQLFDAAFTLKIDNYYSMPRVVLVLKDIKLSEV